MQTEELLKIETDRLQLICCNKQMLEALLQGEEHLKRLLKVNIPERWTEFGDAAFRWTYDRLTLDHAPMEWSTYLPILKAENMLIGSCGFKGQPKEGIVEIGYEVAENYRCRGLGTEIAASLIEHAFSRPEVESVQAHTLAVTNESCRVLEKCGMKKIADIDDPVDGSLWRWEIQRLQPR